MPAGSAVVLGGIGNGVDFILIEPLAQPLVFAHDAGAVGVVLVATEGKPQVMIGCSHKQDALVDLGIVLS